MGQQIGKASFEDDAVPFLNLPGPAVHAVWAQFHLSAESWGLQITGFLETCAPLGPFLGLEPPAMQQRAEGLFALLDTDANGIVDALEFLATLAMLSALEPADKVTTTQHPPTAACVGPVPANERNKHAMANLLRCIATLHRVSHTGRSRGFRFFLGTGGEASRLSGLYRGVAFHVDDAIFSRSTFCR
jgi:hypothetical protein